MTQKMKKQKFMSVLSLMGMLLVVWLGISYTYHMKNRGDLLENQVQIPKDFASQFSRVLSKNRENSVPSTPFISPNGNAMDWPDFQGQYLLVNFWATWCAPCVVELPSLGKLKAQYEGKGLDIIAVSLDTMRGHDDIKAFLKNRNIGDFAAYFDDQQHIQKNISMRGIPTSYLIDPKGNISYIFEGDAHWDSPSAIQFFNNLLNS